jgi:DNA-binding transcriptional LysR family regulator
VLACSTTIGNYVVPSRLAAFKALYPGVEVTLRIGNTGDVASMLHDLQADVGIVEGDVDDPLIEQQEWMEDELVVIAAPDSPFTGRVALDWSELADEQWLTREQGSGTLRTLQRALEHDHVRLAHAHELGHTEAIKRAVESGLGLSCLSRLAVQRELESGTLITVPLRQPLRRWFRILTLPSEARPCGARAAFLDWLRQP